MVNENETYKGINPKQIFLVKFPGGHHKAVNIISNAHALHSATPHGKKPRGNKLGRALDTQQSVTAVLFQNSTTIITAGSVDG